MPCTLVAPDADEYLLAQLRMSLQPLWRVVSRDPETSDCPTVVYLLHASHVGPGTSSRRPLLCYGTAASLEVLDTSLIDDAIVVGWSSSELRFRLRRLSGPVRVRFGENILSAGSHWAGGGSGRVPLTPAHYRILVALMRSGEAGVPREAFNAILGCGEPGNSRQLDMQISRLRHKVAEATAHWTVQPEIVACRGRGYALQPSRTCKTVPQ